MRAGVLVAVIALAASTSGCNPAADDAEIQGDKAADEELYVPPTGSNEIFRTATSAAPGHELIVSDLSLPANAVGEAHFHPWEEYLYVIGGSATLDAEGMDERVLRPGDSFVIPRERVHTPRAGPTGVRAIVVRVHDDGDPLMIPAGQ